MGAHAQAAQAALAEIRQEQRAIRATCARLLPPTNRIRPDYYLEDGAGRGVHLRCAATVADKAATLDTYADLLRRDPTLGVRLITSDPANPYLLIVVAE